MKKIKLRKNFKRIILLTVLIITFIIFFNYPKNYKINYKIQKDIVYEQYVKNNKQYILRIKHNNIYYEFTSIHSYFGKKNIIDDIKIKNTCVTPVSKKIKLYTVCYDKNNKEFFYDNKSNSPKTKKLKQITYNPSKKIFIWNHKGYTLINSNEKIRLFKKEIYYNNLAYKHNNYLITPDYENKNRFNKFYVINLENLKQFTIKSRYRISYDFYYLGTQNDLIYIVDKRTKKEYFINTKKKKVSLVSKNDYGKIWDGKWKEISMLKLSSKEKHFYQDKIYNYSINNKKLYVTINLCSNKIKLSNKEVDKVLYENDDGVYYLVKNKIYYSSPTIKDLFILKYDELEFNSDNQVFLS